MKMGKNYARKPKVALNELSTEGRDVRSMQAQVGGL
jgi:hypothetical protein